MRLVVKKKKKRVESGKVHTSTTPLNFTCVSHAYLWKKTKLVDVNKEKHGTEPEVNGCYLTALWSIFHSSKRRQDFIANKWRHFEWH